MRVGRALLSFGILAFFAILDADQTKAETPLVLGVASCGTATCHNAAQPLAIGSVAQNEYRIWSTTDPHRLAFKALSSDAGLAIARRAGLGAGPEEGLCLSCHTTTPPPGAAAGPHLTKEEGVSCEACHGASSPWIGPHSRGVYQYDEVLAAGLFATADPSARAGMCARCHGPDGGVRHTLLAAGHPRLDFDLASFSRLQPAHYVVDSDYRQRKHPPTEAAIWAIGASTTVSARFRALGDPARSAALFPEFSLLSCGGCHVPLHENVRPAMAPNWRPREILDLSEIPALRAVALATSPALAAEIDGRVQTLKASISRRAVFAAAALDLATVTDRLAVSLKTTNLSGAQALVALQSLPDATAMAANPAAAESALRAIAALARTSLESGVASPADARHLLAQLESLSTLRGGDPPLQAADRAGLRAALVRAAGQTEMIR